VYSVSVTLDTVAHQRQECWLSSIPPALSSIGVRLAAADERVDVRQSHVCVAVVDLSIILFSHLAARQLTALSNLADVVTNVCFDICICLIHVLIVIKFFW